jgi:hypothetical protein
MVLKEIAFVGVDWIHVAQDRDQGERELLTIRLSSSKKILAFYLIPRFITVSTRARHYFPS